MTILKGEIPIESIKRCYIGDVTITVNCLCCKQELVADLSRDSHFSYPKVGSIESVLFCCDKCDIEYTLPVKINSAIVEMEYDDYELSIV